MAVSKPLRYQVFTRDNNTCRYCGASAPDVKLVIDHVTPIALGGTDTADNLVAACEPCNSGKSSTPPGSALVADIDQKAVAWAAARKRVTADLAREFEEETATATRVKKAFAKACREATGKTPNIAADWATSITRWLQLGLPEGKILQLGQYAACRRNVPVTAKWNYLAGACWAVIREIEQRTQTAVTPEEKRSPVDLVAARQEWEANYDPTEDRVQELLTDWWISWKAMAGRHPTSQQDEDFMRAAYALLAEGDVRLGDLFIAARLAGRDQSTDLGAWLEVAQESDPDDPFTAGMYEWDRHWRRVDSNHQVPSEEENVAFSIQLHAALRSDFKPGAVVLAAGLAGTHHATGIEPWLTDVAEVLWLDQQPKGFPEDTPSA